ncbi:MAG TPA: alpha/beta hydrolase [Thermoleophilaceae bacterium]|jgi:pimeloyl-ACP methyl ester carboxylesterase
MLLHGYSDSADTWRPLLRELGERGRRAVAFDLPGFGEADRLAGRGDRFAAGPMLPQLDRFTAALVREQEEPPLIVGNSLGGVAGLRAAQDPDLPLAAVVAISPGGLGHQPWVDLFERDRLLHRVVNAPVPLPASVIRWAVRATYPRFAVFNGSRADRALVADYAAQYSSRADVARVVRDARRLLGELRTAFDLSRVCRPVQLIWGDRDLLTPIKGARRVLDAVDGAELVVLERCGHCAQVEQPERVANLVTRFADRVIRLEAR